MSTSEAAQPTTLKHALATPPVGVRVDNLRRRGVDMVQIQLSSQLRHSRPVLNFVSLAFFAAWCLAIGVGATLTNLPIYLSLVLIGLGLLGLIRSALKSWSINISSGEIEVSAVEGRSKTILKKQFAFADIEGITVRNKIGSTGTGLIFATSKGSFVVGEGLSLEALNWLKTLLILEVAGLTWRPLFSIDRRTRRLRSQAVANPALLSADLALRLIAIYTAEAPEIVKALGGAIQSGDAEQARMHAHWLKSATANVGARQLSELCQRMQIAAGDKDLSRAAILLKEIERGNGETMQWLADIRDVAAANIASPMPQAALLAERVLETNGAAETGAPAAVAPVAPDLATRKLARVLVVDDSAVSREVAKEFLLDLVSTTEFADSGESALKILAKQHFDLILMDCEMFGMNGYECTAQFRSLEKLQERKRTPIVALTAHALRGDRDLCLAAGMDDHLSKPYAPEDLQRIVDQWIAVPQSVAASTIAERTGNPERPPVDEPVAMATAPTAKSKPPAVIIMPATIEASPISA